MSFYPVSLYVPLYPTKHIHLLYHIQINASYIFSFSLLFSSILIYYQPNHLTIAFHSFIPSFTHLLQSSIITSFTPSYYTITFTLLSSYTPFLLTFQGTSSSYQPLLFYSYASLSSNNFLLLSSFSYSSSILIQSMSLSQRCLIQILGHHRT